MTSDKWSSDSYCPINLEQCLWYSDLVERRWCKEFNTKRSGEQEFPKTSEGFCKGSFTTYHLPVPVFDSVDLKCSSHALFSKDLQKLGSEEMSSWTQSALIVYQYRLKTHSSHGV